MADERLRFLITADNASALRGMREVRQAADRELGSAESKADQWSRKFAVAGGAMVGAAGLAATGLFSLGNSASDLNETISKTDQVFKSNADEIHQWSQNSATDFGQSRRAALDAASGFGNLFVQLGVGTDEAADLSRKMVELGSDFASFHNADITQVLEAQSAAFRGEYDAVQRFVPTINAAAVEQKALAMTGKEVTKELTAQEKALAVATLMYEGAGDALGDFDRTADGAANQQRIFNAQLDDLKANIGQGVLPVMTQLIGVGNDVLGVFNSLDPATQKMVGSVATIATVGVGAAGGLALVTSAAIKTGQQLVILKGGVDNFRLGMMGATEAGAGFANRAGLTINRLGGLKAVTLGAGAGVAVLGAGMIAASRDAAEYERALAAAREEVQKGGEAVDRMRERVREASGSQLIFNHDVKAAAQALREYDEETGAATKSTAAAAAAQAEYADLVASGTASEKELAEARARVVETSGETAAVQREVTAAVEEGTGAVDDAAGATQDYDQRIADLKTRMEEARQKQRELTDAFWGGRDAARDLVRAKIDVNEKIAEYEKKASSGTATTEELALAMLDAQDSIDAAAKQTGKLAEEEAKLAGKSNAAEIGHRAQREALVALQTQIGDNSPFRQFLQQTIAELDAMARNRFGTVNIGVKINGQTFGSIDSASINLGGGRATGGPVGRGIPTLVGERGPELFEPNTNGTIIPNHQVASHLDRLVGSADPAGEALHPARPGPASGITVNLTIQALSAAPDDIARAVSGAIPRLSREITRAVIDESDAIGGVPIRIRPS